jgi:hypothetical protein
MLIAAIALYSAGPDFPPIDEGANNVQFAEFRANLMSAIQKKNYEWATSRIALTVKYSFGEDNGKKELLETWDRIPTAREEFFAALLGCLKLGGQFKKHDGKTHFIAPYVFSAWPDEYDAFSHFAVTRAHASVYAKPDEGSEVVSEAGQSIVRYDHSELADGWHWIEYAEDKWAWIKAADVRSPIDYRAIFEKNEVGSYVLVTLVAGD